MSRVRFFVTLTVVVGLCCWSNPSTAQTQEITKADDPLVKVTNEFVDHAFAKGSEGIEIFVFSRKIREDEKEKEALRLTAIGRFADGFLELTKARLANDPRNPMRTITKEAFRIFRVVDTTGRPLDETVVALESPNGLPVKDLNNTPYRSVEWHLKFRAKVKNGDMLIESVVKHFKR